MPRLTKSLTLSLLQARETTMGFFRPILNRHGLTEQQWRIIRVLIERRTVDFQQLADVTCILPPSMTGILTRMQRDGLILKLRPENDQRKVFITLTAEGQDLYETVSPEIEQRYHDIEMQLSHEHLEQLMALLEEVKQLQVGAEQGEGTK
ncbi:homoprotocatechuate degradation operon regulator HpaR [Andreprevotia chitinilytica]|uniref:homoprotocatechuate degradation operon regulator HpaR n=1 Tax=Andreprevotia chitinilytica TaxID=396808 RepID=UPI001B80B6F6|nr:homoprotocatechuate degradation operon regulator HpaR [Andreprevotia chitinilytica]